MKYRSTTGINDSKEETVYFIDKKILGTLRVLNRIIVVEVGATVESIVGPWASGSKLS